ncbi:MAG: hypothetical protein IJE43_06955 [Alphaproteobacteria bacterium]|nr:hypothetical protein [Alphaproteobacteria bacterium]
MNKNLKRTMAVIFSLTTIGSLVGCGARLDEGQETIDSSKSQMYISNYDGGFGSEWLEKAMDRFEEKYKDYSFEPGKKGVQLRPIKNKTLGTALISSMVSSDADVFFTEDVYYYDYVTQGKVLDITDILTEKLTAYGEDKSIVEKMNSTQRDYYTSDGKIYMTPHYQAMKFLTYDVDLFDQYCLYFADDQANSDDGFVWDIAEKRAPGPDGKSGTWDDGMPATYDDFFKLCDRMKVFSIVPVTWSGDNINYVNEFIYELMADYEGSEQFMLNYTFNGTAKNLISVQNGVVTELPDVQITPANAGYELAQQAGKYYAFTFADRLINGNYYDTKTCFVGVSHMQAQKEFLYSSVLNAPKGIFLEGNYWVNEASGAFSTMESTYGAAYSKQNRRLGIMPYPKATKDKVGEENTYVDFINAVGFIRADIAENKKELAKKFLQFCYTDESLDLFTRYTGTVVSLDYEVSNETYNQLSYFGKQHIDFVRNSTRVLPYANNELFKKHAATFTRHYFCSAKINGDVYPWVASAIKNLAVSGETYFKGHIVNRNQAYWNTLV